MAFDLLRFTMILSRKKWLLIAAVTLLVFGGVIVNSLREKTFITQEELATKIDQTLPLGTSIDDVKAFLNSYRSQFQLEIYDYQEPVPKENNEDTPKEPLPTAKGYLGAWLHRSGVIPLSLITWHIKMNFYFDHDKKLVGYKLLTYGDGF